MSRGLSILLCIGVLCADELKVDLRNPAYRNGVLYTSQGGVIQNQDIRIQAQSIQYFHRMEEGKMVQRIEAEGDLLVQYKGRAFIGSELEFDFQKMCGMVYDGKTFASMWYIGGDTVCLNADGSYRVSGATVTTCENKNSTWELSAKRVNVVKDHLFEAKQLRFRFWKLPLLWLPSFKLNLKKFKEPIFRYYVNWNKGPKVGFRYQLYSWRELAFYGRLEYRWAKGWGGAIETEYFPQDGLSSCVTRSYYGKDRLFNAEDVGKRYRFQGAWNSKNREETTSATLTWDKYSDVRMPQDFKSEDFEVNTAMKTLFYIRHQEESFLTSLKVRPKVNPFESIKQDLPTLYFRSHPLELKNSGILSSNFMRASYTNFDYSTQLTTALQNFHSPRLELFQRLERPLHLGALTLSPHLAGRAILYGTSPSHTEKALALLDYGVHCSATGTKAYASNLHMIEPYLTYSALTRPTVSPDSHYIFSMQDGYNQIQQVEVGVRQLLFSKTRPLAPPLFTANLYANAFFSDPVIPQLVPRLYLWLNWNLSSLAFSWHNCYNFRNQLFDFSNARLRWTVNENIAMSIEGRYRSKYDWRKSDHENFILDVTRTQSELLTSPLSDRRVTLLTNLFFRLNPFWELQFESHHGLARLYKNSIHSPSYNEFKIHLYRWISAAWKLHFYYGYTVGNHFDWTINLQLVKKGF